MRNEPPGSDDERRGRASPARPGRRVRSRGAGSPRSPPGAQHAVHGYAFLLVTAAMASAIVRKHLQLGVACPPGEQVADLAEVVGDDELLAGPGEVVGELVEHPHRGDVDERDRLGVEHDARHARGGGVRLDRRRARRRRWRRTARPRRGARARPDRRRSRGGASRSPNWSGLPGTWPSSATWGLRRPVEQEQQRHDDADDQPGQRVEDEHAEHGGHRGDEVGAGGRAVDRAEPPGVEPVEADAGRRCRPARSRRRSRRRPAWPRAGPRTAR